MFQHHSLIIFLTLAAISCNVVAMEAHIDHPQVARQAFSRGCRMNVCFALDGSDSVSMSDFSMIRSFVIALVRRLSELNKIQVAGVQYGFLSLPISPLTNDTRRFRQLLRETDFEEADFTRVSGGMVYCFGQLRSPPVLLPRARIVILGSGEAELGIDPGTVAGLFRAAGGSIFGIGVDDASSRNLAEFLGGFRNVFTLRRRFVHRMVDRLIPALCRG